MFLKMLDSGNKGKYPPFDIFIDSQRLKANQLHTEDISLWNPCSEFHKSFFSISFLETKQLLIISHIMKDCGSL